jgi:Fur family ferric uptake transcriptional regulator
MSDWATHAKTAMREAGLRHSAQRDAVVELLARQTCALSAQQIDDGLRRRRRPAASRATVYRALEQLAALRLVQRLDVGLGEARYEPVRPDRDHHHHLVCDECGQLTPFEDAALEQAIDRVSRSASFSVQEHDVVLHGLCDSCSA